uniref:TIR domain-containing protein n=1 Tax=Haptolina ericina TaxID=156174 RepID=A0A7S3C1C2_9EUKA
MAAACSLALVVLFILCGLYKFAALTDLDDVQRVMSLELKLDYLTSYVSLSTILMLACLSAFLVLGSIVTVLAFEDERRRRHDARVALARRLRYKDGGEEVDLGALRKNAGFSTQKLQKNDEFQLFLSHNWKHGQSEMRIVKKALLEMLPGIQVFLDVDNLGGGADHPHIDVSGGVLCYCTQRWFTSHPCVREVVRAVLRKKPLIALLEADQSDIHGGYTEKECRRILMSEEYRDILTSTQMRLEVASWANDWGDESVRVPEGGDIVKALFEASTPIVWYRLADLQDISLRLIAEWVLTEPRKRGKEYKQLTYYQGELVHKLENNPITFVDLEQQPSKKRRGSILATSPIKQRCGSVFATSEVASQHRKWHLYCSPENEGAKAVGQLLEKACGGKHGFKWTDREEKLEQCGAMLVLLNRKTWSNPLFAKQVRSAMLKGVRLQLVHEVPGAQKESYDRPSEHVERYDCPFDEFFDKESTPKQLIDAGLYTDIAMNLGGGEWRHAGILALAKQLHKEGVGPRSKRVVQELPAETTQASTSQHEKLVLPRDGSYSSFGECSSCSSASRERSHKKERSQASRAPAISTRRRLGSSLQTKLPSPERLRSPEKDDESSRASAQAGICHSASRSLESPAAAGTQALSRYADSVAASPTLSRHSGSEAGSPDGRSPSRRPLSPSRVSFMLEQQRPLPAPAAKPAAAGETGVRRSLKEGCQPPVVRV